MTLLSTRDPKIESIYTGSSESKINCIIISYCVVLADRMALRFVNQYSAQITDELYPAVGPVIDNIQMEMCNKMLAVYPFDVLLPPARTK